MAYVIYRLPRILIAMWASPADVRGIRKLLHTFTSRMHLTVWTGWRSSVLQFLFTPFWAQTLTLCTSCVIVPWCIITDCSLVQITRNSWRNYRCQARAADGINNWDQFGPPGMSITFSSCRALISDPWSMKIAQEKPAELASVFWHILNADGTHHSKL